MQIRPRGRNAGVESHGGMSSISLMPLEIRYTFIFIYIFISTSVLESICICTSITTFVSIPIHAMHAKIVNR